MCHRRKTPRSWCRFCDAFTDENKNGFESLICQLSWSSGFCSFVCFVFTLVPKRIVCERDVRVGIGGLFLKEQICSYLTRKRWKGRKDLCVMVVCIFVQLCEPSIGKSIMHQQNCHIIIFFVVVVFCLNMFVFVQGSWFDAVNQTFLPFSPLFVCCSSFFCSSLVVFFSINFQLSWRSGVDFETTLSSCSSSYMLCVVSLRWSNPMSYRESAPSTLCLRWLCLTLSYCPSTTACRDFAPPYPIHQPPTPTPRPVPPLYPTPTSLLSDGSPVSSLVLPLDAQQVLWSVGNLSLQVAATIQQLPLNFFLFFF